MQENNKFEIMETKIFELNKICRICLSQTGQMKSLFDSCLDSMIKSIANILVSLGDGLPELICFQCVLQVSRTFRFKNQCEKSDEILRQYIETKNETLINQKCNSDKKFMKEIISYDDNNDQFKYILSNSNKLDENIRTENVKKSSDILQNHCSKSKINLEKVEASLKSCYIKICKFENEGDNKAGKKLSDFKSTNLDYTCKICSKKFAKQKAFLRHNKIHYNCKYFKCSECDKIFIEKSNLTKHIKKHTGELRNITGKPNLCVVCGKCFKWSSSLSKHMQYHTKNKIYKCTHCPKYYVENRSLQIHLRNHTGEKPYKCDVCCLSFTQLCNLQKHLHVHAIEKPFSCQICNKKFSQSGYIKIHMRSHTGEKPYQCQECGKCFSTSSNLIIHKKRHSGNRSYSCNYDLKNHSKINCQNVEKISMCIL